MEKKFDKVAFKEKLELSGQFPMKYMFKFIVPYGNEDEIKALFPHDEISFKPSSGKKYVSATIYTMMDSADQIIEIYEQASAIEHVIAL
jgi:putative lipoic acid-binding regulatory protein